jgi:two-component system response regulator AtoC
LHAHSRRAERPLIRFNCAAIPAELAEAELFGHARGAYTGAVGTRRGFFAEADGGTLILDEVGELPSGVQAKLLRVLQEGEIQPVGSGRVDKVDVRVVASTNRDLATEARTGRFREDLYYRLAVVELVVPPLRDRRDDIPALAEEFARRYAEKFELGVLRLDAPLIDALSRHDWPGNVRQLENTVARLAALSTGGTIGLADYHDQLGGDGSPPDDEVIAEPEPITTGDGAGTSLRDQVEAFERGVITRVLDAAGGNQSEAARRLGVSRVTLIDKLKKYGLTRPK